MRKKRWNVELEAKVKLVMNNARNKNEALKLLQREGFSVSESSKLVQRFYRSIKRDQQPHHQQQHYNANSPPSSKQESPKRNLGEKVLSPRDQQLELITFSQNIHLLNQEFHKNLRRNKSGVRAELVEKLPPDYKRPPGFVLVPGLLGTVPGGDGEAHRIRSRRTSRDDLDAADDNLNR